MNELVTGLRPYVHDHDPDIWRVEGAVFTGPLADLVPNADRPMTGIHVFRHHERPAAWEGMPAWILSDRGAASSGHAAALTITAAVMHPYDDTILFDAHPRGVAGLTAPDLGRMLQAVQLLYATFPDGDPLASIAGRMPYDDPGRVPCPPSELAIPDADEASGVRRPWGRCKGMSPEECVAAAVAAAGRRGHTPVRRNPDGQKVWRGWCEACHMDLMVFPATLGGDCLLKDCPMPKSAEKEGE